MAREAKKKNVQVQILHYYSVMCINIILYYAKLNIDSNIRLCIVNTKTLHTHILVRIILL